jgi:hypothetical protein
VRPGLSRYASKPGEANADGEVQTQAADDGTLDEIRRRAFDLTNIASVDVGKLVAYLA